MMEWLEQALAESREEVEKEAEDSEASESVKPL